MSGSPAERLGNILIDSDRPKNLAEAEARDLEIETAKAEAAMLRRLATIDRLARDIRYIARSTRYGSAAQLRMIGGLVEKMREAKEQK